MNTLKILFCCALFAVAGCVGAEPTDEAADESEVAVDESDVAPSPEALPVEDTPDMRMICWADDGIPCCAPQTGGEICCYIEGGWYCG